MRMLPIALALALSTVLHPQTPLRPDPPSKCFDCDEWNTHRDPARVFGNTYSVGVAGISAVAISSEDGLILLDGALPQTAPIIDGNLRTLGFRTADIRFILNSHAHYDHAGGIAALQRASGATVVASAEGARAIERGEPVANDPQFAFGRKANQFPAVKNVRVVGDGEVVRLGAVTVTAHLTPGHTPGSTTWAWQSCDGPKCQQIVYADSLNPVSAPGFRFTGGKSHPDIVPQFRRSIEKVAALPCDILMTVHPSFAEGKTCRTYAEDALKRLTQRIAEERN
jgi:metallo-beta-lactamase class B